MKREKRRPGETVARTGQVAESMPVETGSNTQNVSGSVDCEYSV